LSLVPFVDGEVQRREQQVVHREAELRALRISQLV
jgi:hypothetical protein